MQSQKNSQSRRSSSPPITEVTLDPQGPQGPPAPQAPYVLQALHVLQQPILHMLPLNWSHFKPKFSGKPDEDTKAHLLRMNDQMETHKFQGNDKVQRILSCTNRSSKTIVQIFKTDTHRLDTTTKFNLAAIFKSRQH